MYLVGKILKPQGLKGEVKVQILSSFPERFKEYQSLIIKGEHSEKQQIEYTRIAKEHAYIKFAQIKSRNDAELFRNKELWIEEQQLSTLKTGEYFHHNLVGMKIISEQGDDIGNVTDIETYPANDVLVVDTGLNEDVLIPVIKDIIKDVNLENEIITIHVMEGLLD